jgi:hypothetical protein
MNRPIVLCLQYYHGDKEAAIRNAIRIADNEPNFREDIEFCFVTRRGTEHDGAAIQHVEKKFKTTAFTSQRFGNGHPHACNETWCELMQESHRRVRSGQWANVRALFTFESDAVPVSRRWLDVLHEEWTKTENEGKWLGGCVGHGPHLNGNLLTHPNLFHFMPKITGCPANVGWDWHFRRDFEPHWRASNFIANLYNQKGVPRSVLQGLVDEGVSVVHGIKDDSAEKFADTLLRK